MRLWAHVWAHRRNPLYAFCEWYVFGRHSNWDEVPTPIGVENDLPDAEIRRMWDEGKPVELGSGKFHCEHTSVSGPVLSATCGICGPMRRMLA